MKVKSLFAYIILSKSVVWLCLADWTEELLIICILERQPFIVRCVQNVPRYSLMSFIVFPELCNAKHRKAVFN
eukprot:scaffold2981_cov154-Ochromonas_danica.AAC.1